MSGYVDKLLGNCEQVVGLLQAGCLSLRTAAFNLKIVVKEGLT